MKLIEILGQVLKVKMSPSFIKNAGCPLYLKLNYIDHAEDRPSMPAQRGRSVHAAIADLLKLCTAEEVQPEELGLETMKEALEKHLPHSIMSQADLILEWLMLWGSRYKISEHLYSYEEKIGLDDEYEDTEWDDASYRGILDVLDVIDEICIVTDWKSQPNILAQTDLDNPTGSDQSEQITHYCWLASKRHRDLEVFKGRIWYLRYGFYQETTRTLDQLDIYETALIIKERKISEISDWEPRAGKQCDYCEFHHLCPLATDTGSADGEVITQEQAVQCAENVTAMEAYLKARKGALKDYIKANDSIRTGAGIVWGYNKKLSDFWPAKAVEEVLEDYEMPLSDVANVDARKMKKLLKTAAREHPGLEQDLQDVREDKHSTRFEGYKPKD
jgi:hypothetical protein